MKLSADSIVTFLIIAAAILFASAAVLRRARHLIGVGKCETECGCGEKSKKIVK